MKFTIGVDVGGTNTDVAIIDGTKVIGWSKSSTTEKITDGVINAIESAFKNAVVNGYSNVKENIKRVNIGTTHFINAVIKRENLSKVACVRLCGDASHCLPPFVDFPEDLQEQVDGGYYLLDGGFEFDESLIAELKTKEIINTIKAISNAGIKHVAVVGIFSPTNPSQEKVVEELLMQEFPEATYTLSHQLGYLGLLERENATILNESLKVLCQKTIAGFKSAMQDIGLNCLVYFTQNDGTLISEQQVLKFPVFTFSSGATNSMRGAAHLSSLKDAIIVDIGGTSTDVGVLMNGFPRGASSRVKVGGVNTNFRMPDTKSIGLGGGSIVKIHDDQTTCSVGPSSVEYRITEKALIFGGDTLVTTDVAVASGRVELGNKANVSHLSDATIQEVMGVIQEKVEAAVDSIKLSGDVCPVVVVGGGSILIDAEKPFVGASYVVKPSFYQVANAVGAALSKVSGTVDKLVTITEANPRERHIKDAKEEAIEIAVQNGAIRDTCNIVDVSEIEMSYMIVPCVRLHVKAVGDLELDNADNTNEVREEKAPSKLPATTFKVSQQEKKQRSVAGKGEVELKDHVEVSNIPALTPAGEWILNLWDVDCLAIGAGILGCGGGGSPYLGRLRLKRCVEKGMKVKIIHPLSLKEDEAAYCVAFMGAPEVLIERISNGCELKQAVSVAYNLQMHGFKSGMSKEDIQQLADEKGLKLEHDETKTTVKLRNLDIDGKPAAIGLCEIGGLNALEPLIAAAELGLPVLDCDGMGRAFPQLQQFGPFINGTCPYPAVITDHHGNYVCCVKCASAMELENFFRKHCISMGCCAGVMVAPLSSKDIQTKTCLFTLSQAWYLGNTILNARQLHMCPVEAILKETNGILLCQGKINNLHRETKDGFTWGKIDIEGSGVYQNKNMTLEFQNEFIVAKSSEKIVATTPDLITLVDTDTGEPITTDELKYGLRVTTLVLPCPPIMNSKKALEFVGPKAFKYENVEYHPSCEYVAFEPIPRLMKK
ncbi:uncharacterized protein LOC130657611 [Hydractinia symbiolongicarpus]|uniref:uncharacterized protein LOC130657611 n=1 Tax=Hydractinia symbiolongicarpus TaxID=13093 RepID=UPI00254DB919|nr:uncharacterized protein LOC130657611 [Hydractinia symbiolongicarpus]